MNREKVNRLSKLLDFVQRDHSKITNTEERQKLCREFGDLTQSSFLYFDGKQSGGLGVFSKKDGTSSIKIDMLQSYCNNAAELFRIIYTTKENDGSISYGRDFTVSCYSQSPDDTFSQSATIKGDMPKPITISYDLPDSPPTERHKRFKTYSYAEVIFDLLEGFPTAWLRECRECKKLFVQKTAMEKLSCSAYCRNEYNTRLREEQKK